jgi:tetratricopeptide (TPR) repeat protein
MPSPSHVWIRCATALDPAFLPDLVARELPGLAPALLPPVCAHRRLRGPYTAAGTVLRAVTPRACQNQPALVERHQIELLSTAPELRAQVPATRATLTSLAVPKERTRFYSRLRTLRLSHGVVEFLQALLTRDGSNRSLVVYGVEAADHTDLEFLAVLLRRMDPALLTVVVCVAGPVPEDLAPALDQHAVCRSVSLPESTPPADDLTAVIRYIASDCTLELPALVAAYDRLPAHRRAELHDQRAAELERTGEPSRVPGAIAYHREHGSDPSGAGGDALLAALNTCVDMGFYHATIDAARRGRAVIDWDRQVEHWWTFTTKMTVSLAALGRPAEAEDLYSEAIAYSESPVAHMQAAYARAMLYTRHNAREEQDHQRAKGLLKQAVAFAKVLYEGKERAFRVAFNRNGLALVEAHLNNLPEALRLVCEGIEMLDAELAPDEHRLHRSVLMHNRAQVLVGLRRLPEALEGLNEVIEVDPYYPDYYLDRGNIRYRMGQYEEALADFDTAISLGPPFPEAQYNRAELLMDAGAEDEALECLDYVLTLDPEMVDAYVNRAGIHLERGALDKAHADALAGLRLDEANPHLLVVLAGVHAERGALTEARADFDRAVATDPTLVAALVGRAAVARELEDREAALADLDRAVTLAPEDPAVRFNRAVVHQDVGQWSVAMADLEVAQDLAPDDTEIADALRHCRESVVRV